MFTSSRNLVLAVGVTALTDSCSQTQTKITHADIQRVETQEINNMLCRQ